MDERDYKAMNEEEIKRYPFEDLPGETKDHIIREFTVLTAKHALQLFMSLGLQTHFECMVINEPTGEEFILSFKKLAPKQND